MKKIFKAVSNVLLWLLAVFFFLIFLVETAPLSRILALIFAVLVAPVSFVQNTLLKVNFKGAAKAFGLFALFLAVVFTSESASGNEPVSMVSPAVYASEPTETEIPIIVETTKTQTEPTAAPEPTEAPTTVPETEPETVPQTVPTVPTAAEPTIEPVTEPTAAPETEPTQATTTETESSEPQEEMVWIPTGGGKKYHSRPGCSNMNNPQEVTISQAEARGFTPCKRCY